MIGRIAMMIVTVNVIMFCMDVYWGERLSALKDFNVVGAWVVLMLYDRMVRKMKCNSQDLF